MANKFSVVRQTTAKKGFLIQIDYSLCANCGACVAVCPEDVLYLGPVMLSADDTRCTGCRLCVISCPADALRLRDDKTL